MPAPDGPRNLTPASLFLSDGSSGIVYVFQICLPVRCVEHRTRPRIVQQTWLKLADSGSSSDATGT
jgi:hypothetical protein